MTQHSVNVNSLIYQLLNDILVKEYVVLWTHSQRLTYLLHVSTNVQTIDGRVPVGRWKQTAQYRPANSVDAY